MGNADKHQKKILGRETEKKEKEKAVTRTQAAQSPVVRCRMNSVKSLMSFIKRITISLLLVLSQSFCFIICVLAAYSTHRALTLWWRYFRRTHREYGERFDLNPRTFPRKYYVIQSGERSSSLVGWLVTSMFGKSVPKLLWLRTRSVALCRRQSSTHDLWVPTLYFIAGTVFWAPWSRVALFWAVNTFYAFYGTQRIVIITLYVFHIAYIKDMQIIY
jgi:hypothetical protein